MQWTKRDKRFITARLRSCVWRCRDSGEWTTAIAPLAPPAKKVRERKALKVTRGGHSFSPRYIRGKLDAAGRIRTQLPLHSSALDQGASMLPGGPGSSPRPFCYVCFFVKLCTFNTLEEYLIVRCTAALWTLSSRAGAVVVSIIASNKELHKKKVSWMK